MSTESIRDVDRDALIESFMPWANSLARKCHHWSLGPDDLKQIAMLGVIEAVDTFDPARGASLRTFVRRNIEWALGNEFQRARRQCRSMAKLSSEPVDSSGDDRGDQQSDELWEAIEALPYRDQERLIDGYGLDGYPPMSHTQIGARDGCSRKASGARQQATIKALRVALTA